MDYHRDNFLCSERNSTKQICFCLYDFDEYYVNADHHLCEHNFHKERIQTNNKCSN